MWHLSILGIALSSHYFIIRGVNVIMARGIYTHRHASYLFLKPNPRNICWYVLPRALELSNAVVIAEVVVEGKGRVSHE